MIHINRNLFCLAALLASQFATEQAIAQNTAQAALFRQDVCTVVGRRAQRAYRYKELGQPFPYHLVSTTLPDTALHMWAIHYATDKAVSADDAVRSAVAMCYDNVDKVFRDDRYGIQTKEADLR